MKTGLFLVKKLSYHCAHRKEIG